MNAIQQKCRPKHQVLVLKCYPRTTKGAVGVKPNSSELSYLLFYATSRRSKIQKIGSYLEKKTATDVWRLRIGNVQVTLQILTALIEKSPKDLPLFAPNVLKILDLVLGSKDITMAESSLPTLEAFCENHDASSSFADQSYLTQYESVVRSYATLASTRRDPGKAALSKPVLMRWRDVGLEAIRSVSSSDPLSSVAGRQFHVIVPIILENLWWEDYAFLGVLLSRIQMEEKVESDKLLRRRTSVATVKTADTTTGDANPIAIAGTATDVDKLAEEDVGLLALQCLKEIYVIPNQAQIHAATAAILEFVLERVKQGDAVVEIDPKTHKADGWAIRLIDMVARWAPVQDRYVILVTTMDQLLRLPTNDEGLRQQLVLTTMVSSLLRSDVNLIGLSVMDVLLNFIHLMKKLLQAPLPNRPFISTKTGSGGLEKENVGGEQRSPSTPQAASAEGESTVRLDLLDRIQRAIGDIATHVYYADQISDMISAILVRLRPSRSSSTNSSPHRDNGNGGGGDNTPATDDAAASGTTNLDSYLSFGLGKMAALKAIKSILLVASPKSSPTGNLNLSRHRVPIHVWEGTHWLLMDPDGQVRRAYVDALLAWLDRETTVADLKARDERLPHRSPLNKSVTREALQSSQSQSGAGGGGGGGDRVVSGASQREKSIKHRRSHFLQLLHIAIYDNALQYVDYEADMVLLHVLLAKMVSRLGINTVRYGLPMIFRLQEDIQEVETPLQKVRIGSLCHGYFWAVSEQFELESTAVGHAIQTEIVRRRSKNFWIEGVQVPPPPLEFVGVPGVAAPRSSPKIAVDEVESEALLPFDDRMSLVECIATGYAESTVSPPLSPAASPGRSFSHPILGVSSPGQTAPSNVAGASADHELPIAFRELMLTDWTRDAALIAIQAGSKSESMTGSRSGTTATARRHRLGVNGGGGANGFGQPSPVGSQHNLNMARPGSSQVPGLSPGAMQNMRKSSVRSGVSLSPSASSRGPVTSIEQLKMVLSGQLSPTEVAAGTSAGPPRDAEEEGDVSSDSMASYEMTPSELSFNPMAGSTSQPDGGGDSTATASPSQGQSLHLQRTMSHGERGGPLSSNPTGELVSGGDRGDTVPPVPALPRANSGSFRGRGDRQPLQLQLQYEKPSTATGSPTHVHTLKPAKRNISSRSGESSRFRTPLKEEPATESMDLRDLLLGIDSRAGEHSIGNITRPPY